MIVLIDYDQPYVDLIPKLEENLRYHGFTIMKPLITNSLTMQFHSTSVTLKNATRLATNGEHVAVVGLRDPVFSFNEVEQHAINMVAARYGMALIHAQEDVNASICIEAGNAFDLQTPEWCRSTFDNFTGWHDPYYILVGDKNNHHQTRYAWPFHANMHSSQTLHAALIKAEMERVAIINAYDPMAETMLSYALNSVDDSKIIALGGNASRWLELNDFMYDGQVMHPAYKKRFQQNNISQYARELRVAAGLDVDLTPDAS